MSAYNRQATRNQTIQNRLFDDPTYTQRPQLVHMTVWPVDTKLRTDSAAKLACEQQYMEFRQSHALGSNNASAPSIRSLDIAAESKLRAGITNNYCG